MKNEKMFNADSNMNAILVHSLQKNVSNNRSMKNTFLTTTNEEFNLSEVEFKTKNKNAFDAFCSLVNIILAPMKNSQVFAKTMSLTAIFMLLISNLYSQCTITFPSNVGSVPAQGSTLYFTDCDGNGTEVISWIAPTATRSGTCGGVTVTQQAGPANGSSMPVGSTTVNYSAQAVNTVTFDIVVETYSFNIVVQSANPSAGGITNAQTICAGTDPAMIASASDICTRETRCLFR